MNIVSRSHGSAIVQWGRTMQINPLIIVLLLIVLMTMVTTHSILFSIRLNQIFR